MNLVIRISAVAAVLLLTFGCSILGHKNHLPLNQSEQYYDFIQPTFSRYLNATETWLRVNRAYITSDRERELAMNMPFELSTEQPADKAILLVHGLGDSPFSFSDLAVSLRDQGFYVQTLLLPGHGSKPEDLQLPSYADWQAIVDQYAKLLKEDYQEVWLGGFSTGGNLVTIHAIEQGGVDGLILVSPGFQSRTPTFERLAPLASVFTDGYSTEERNIVRYTSAPINGAIAYSDSALKLRDLLDEGSVVVPTLIVMSEADSVVDSAAVEKLYRTRFDNPRNQLIWYGESKPSDPSITALTMRLAHRRISTGSHMSPLFAPSNPYYGEKGARRMCMNSFDREATARCEQGEGVWFSAWGYEEAGKVHARLTWNPYYSSLERSIQGMARGALY